MFGAKVVVTGLSAVEAKLTAAPARILAHNLGLVKSMLEFIKPIYVAAIPEGPGHFGYHLRDTVTTDTRFVGIKTIGVLKTPAQGYWREFGTLGSYTKGREVEHYVEAVQGHMGERAFMTAHKALSGARKFISFYYNGMAAWWRSA